MQETVAAAHRAQSESIFWRGGNDNYKDGEHDQCSPQPAGRFGYLDWDSCCESQHHFGVVAMHFGSLPGLWKKCPFTPRRANCKPQVNNSVKQIALSPLT